MVFLTLMKNLNVVVITGNPFASSGSRGSAYINLEKSLAQNLSAVVINDLHLIDDKGFIKKGGAAK